MRVANSDYKGRRSQRSDIEIAAEVELDEMLRFTKRADYGLMAMHFIASHCDEVVVSAKRIAEEFHIPAERLAKILQRLAKKGLITSHNGPKGGYALTREAGDITVGQVVRALEGPLRIVSCMSEKDDCPQFSRCNLRGPVQRIQTSISMVLDGMTLAELATDPVIPVGALRRGENRWP